MATRAHPSYLLILTSCLLALGANASEDSPEAWETYLDLEVAGKILGTYFEDHASAELLTEPLSMDEFANKVPEPYKSRLPLKDGWGHKLMVAEADDVQLIVSAGENGVHEIIENFAVLTSDEPYFGDEADLYGDDFYFVVGRGVEKGPRTLASRQETTMQALRIIGTSVEEFSIDHNFYPFETEGFQELDTVEDQLSSVYPRKLPRNDAWGTALLYWSDRESYVILSTGADGLLDPGWSENPPDQVQLAGETSDPDADIVFGNGSFIQWPNP